MRHEVKDVMTSEVICAQASTPYKELVWLLTERYVNAVPVVDAERHVLGIVSQADLLLKQQHPADHFREDVPLAVGFRWGLHDGSYFQVPTAAGRSSIPGSSAVARSSARASWGSSW